MLKSLKVLFFLCLLTLVFSNSAFAASGKFLSQANKYYNTICKLPLVTMNLALDCYVFDKVGEMATVISDMQLKVGDLISSNNSQNTRISILEEENASQQEEIQTLTEELENTQGVPEPQKVEHFSFQQLIPGKESNVFTTDGFRQIVLDGESQSGSCAFHLSYSNDQQNWNTQGSINVASGLWNEHMQKSFQVLGEYYKVTVVNSCQGWASSVLY